jgi:hypothetical protein
MSNNLDKYKNDLKNLIDLGDQMKADLMFRHQHKTGKIKKEDLELAQHLKGKFETEYQRWYTESTVLIRQLIPDRLEEFSDLYKGDGKRKVINASTYHIQDWLNGVRSGTEFDGTKTYDDFAVISMRFSTQLAILKSVAARFESSLFDIKQLVQADLLDSEIDAARVLNNHGFARASGAVSGVVLEKHLAQVCMNHSVAMRKKDPGISDFNDALKNAGILDVPLWRQIQRLGDLRNLCDHNKHREPTTEEIEELINGVEKISKTVF